MKTSEKTKTELAAERDKAMVEAHKKYVEAMEKARRDYIEAKRKVHPELFWPSPEEAARTIDKLQARVKELEKKEGLK